MLNFENLYVDNIEKRIFIFSKLELRWQFAISAVSIENMLPIIVVKFKSEIYLYFYQKIFA